MAEEDWGGEGGKGGREGEEGKGEEERRGGLKLELLASHSCFNS